MLQRGSTYFKEGLRTSRRGSSVFKEGQGLRTSTGASVLLYFKERIICKEQPANEGLTFLTGGLRTSTGAYVLQRGPIM